MLSLNHAFDKKETGNGLFFIWKAIYEYKIFHTYYDRQERKARKVEEDIMREEIFYACNAPISKNEIEMAEENLDINKIIDEGSSILLQKLRNSAFDGDLTSRKVDFYRETAIKQVLYEILTGITRAVTDFRINNDSDRDDVFKKLNRMYLLVDVTKVKDSRDLFYPKDEQFKLISWSIMMERSPALFEKMAENYLEIVKRFDETLNFFEHNDVFCKQCRIRRISNAIYKKKIVLYINKNNEVYMNFKDSHRRYKIPLALKNYDWIIKKDKADEQSDRTKSLRNTFGNPYDPFENMTKEKFSKLSLEVIAERIDMVFSHSDDVNLDSDAVVPFYRMLHMIFEDGSFCISSARCPESDICKSEMAEINGPRKNRFMSNGMHW